MSTNTQKNTAEIDGVCDMLHNMNTVDNTDSISICANCGKEGSDVTNTCNKCISVKYCNAACKKKHRHKHKKECERRVAELHYEQLFKQPPKEEDCPICFLRLPILFPAQVYMACCGKVICCGCMWGVQKGDRSRSFLCPFCRVPIPTSDVEAFKRTKKRMNLNDANAFRNLGCGYNNGEYRLPKNYAKALELWHQAGELGCTDAYYNIANAYAMGTGVSIDMKKALHYWEISALGGNAASRHNLGEFERQDGNHHRALKHFIIAVQGGEYNSLNAIQRLYTDGHATKEDYAKALRAYQAYLDEIRSVQRDEAAAAQGDYRYYYPAYSSDLYSVGYR